jgi:hypothetical protein
LPECVSFSQFLGLDTLHDPLTLGYQHIQLLVGAYIQGTEALKELVQVADGGIPEDFGPTIGLTTQTIR